MRRRVWMGWLLGAAALLVLGAKPRAETPPPLKPIDLNHPPREYVERSVHGWKLFVEKELAVEHPRLAKKATQRLDKMLGRTLAVLPPHSHDLLRKLPLFLLYGEKAKLGGRDNGLEYFQRVAPKHFPNVDPRMASSVVIYSAENYVQLSDLWALKALVHEFAHAWQLEQWPEKQKDILGAYRKAMERKLYREVERNDGKIIDKAYATANQLEYFAELSCAYFARCDYHPCTRAELEKYDPDGYRMIRKMWRVDEAPKGQAGEKPPAKEKPVPTATGKKGGK